ncbi:MAG: NADP-dependent malic enzyme [Alphaproteobacteria bacterium]|nr:NADP-dependent malic enzyme [Alphaproteobacteria bacterium]
MDKEELKQAALDYHAQAPAGKLAITATKPMVTQRDLSLAYSPGVASACLAIEENPEDAAKYTARGNLLAVVSNGTAVLGLGAIGPLASKPVMEGKAVLFKKFANINVFDIEVDETDVDKFVDIVAALEPTFGGINLEDIKAPQCFEIERKLIERCNIPIFHDDQHGTAIIVCAAIINALQIVDKKIENATMTVSGAGAAAIACLGLLVNLGMRKENIFLCDSRGVVYEGRDKEPDQYKDPYRQKTDKRTLQDALENADIFLGLSKADLLKGKDIEVMAKSPLIFGLSNPVPEIMPDDALAHRPDAIIATGRSDFPNQVNNVLCFPFLFRGALDVGATEINIEMKKAAVYAIAELARREVNQQILLAYGDEDFKFGKDYIIPKPFDPRLLTAIAPAVAQAAMDSNVATRPLKDMEAYKQRMHSYVYRTSSLMRPLYSVAKMSPARIVYADGEDFRVLDAVQQAVIEGIAKPIIIGRKAVVQSRIERLNIKLKMGHDYELCDPEDDPRYREYREYYYKIQARNGVTEEDARRIVRTNATAIASIMVHRGEADSLICGLTGRYHDHLRELVSVFTPPAQDRVFALTAISTAKRDVFLADTHVQTPKDPEDIVNIAVRTAEYVKSLGIEPKVALLSHSQFGTSQSRSAVKMREAVRILHEQHPNIQVEGEMHADTAFDEAVRNIHICDSKLTGTANILIFPTIEAGNIAYNCIKVLAEGVVVGPVLMGLSKPVSLVTDSITAHGLLNMTAVTVANLAYNKG